MSSATRIVEGKALRDFAASIVGDAIDEATGVAQQAVEPILGAGRIGDAGDAPHQIARLAAQHSGAVGVGDVVGREDRIVDRREPVELVRAVALRFAVCLAVRLSARSYVNEVSWPSGSVTG